jgi:signal transduction histidine kinase
MRAPRLNIGKISTKVALSYVCIAILQGGLSILTFNFVTSQAMEASLDDQRRKTGRLIDSYITDARKEMTITADLLAGQGKLVNLLSRRETSTLAYELSFYLAPLKLDTILVVDSAGRKVVDVGSSAISNMLLKRNPFDALEKGYSTTISGEGNRIQLWGLHEIVANGKRRGMLCAARRLDRSFIGRIEEISGTQMLLALRKTILVNGRLGDNIFIEYSRRVTADPDLGASGSIKSYVYRTTHLPDYPELELVYFIDTAPSIKLLSRYVTSTLFILAATIVVALITAILLYRYTFQKPFAAFQDAIRRISMGDLSFKFSQTAETEFAGLEREFEAMTENLRKVERELQISSRMAAVGEMVAGVAHQIRNPLAIMKVSAEMIRDSVPPVGGIESAVSANAETAKGRKGGTESAVPAEPETAKGRKRKPRPGADADIAANAESPQARKAARRPETDIRPLVEMIVSEIDSLGAIVSKFLDFTKPLNIKLDDVRVPEFLARVASLIPMRQFPGRTVRVEASPEAARAVFDKRLMEQAVCNLIENALAASNEGGEVLVKAERRIGESGREFRVSVGDSGAGMSEDVRSQLFHPFFTTKSDGTGLGLSIVHRIVEEHGGTIDVKSKIGRGTEITIILKEGES